MELDIILNKYVLMWHLLYDSSVSLDMHLLKQRIWKEERIEYSNLHKEKSKIMANLDDYIPDDDTVFNIVESSDAYKKIKYETSRYRLTILEIWDKQRKSYVKELKSLLKFSLNEKYKVCVIHPLLNVVEADFDDNTITLGKKLTARDKDDFLTYLIYKILKHEFSKIKTNERSIVDAILELIVTNELYTRVTNVSKYAIGKKELRAIKEKIYPYFLMYIGVSHDDFEKYMIRDSIFFNTSSYTYEPLLKTMDIFSFIKFVIKNKRYIFNQKTVNVESVEVL